MLNVESIKPWSGLSTGEFHIDYLGVMTDPRFWKGITPSRAGRLRVSPPVLSEAYFEYAACIVAASLATGLFQALEIGAGWGVWSVRAAVVARHLGLPVRTTAIEMMPEQCAQIARHFMTNGLDPRCHAVIQAAVGESSGSGWVRTAAGADPGARLVQADWAMRNAVIPFGGIPFDISVPCRDGTQVMRVRTRRLKEIINPTSCLDFVHLRIGPNPQSLLSDPVLAAENVGLLVIPGIAKTDLISVQEAMAGTSYTKVCSLEHGQVLKGSRGEVTVQNALRIYAGGRVPPDRLIEMTDYFSRLSAPVV